MILKQSTLLFCVGSVKDSVVGEERIAQYLLAVLNTRGTPIHWKHLTNREIESLHRESDDNPNYNLQNLLPKWRKPPSSKSDVHYIEVTFKSFMTDILIFGESDRLGAGDLIFFGGSSLFSIGGNCILLHVVLF